MTPTPPVADATLNRRLKGLTGAFAILMVLLGFFEGDRLTAYHDVGGVPTICRGITHGVTMGEVMTSEQCQQMDAVEALQYMGYVKRYVHGDQTPARQAALADFAYNVGLGNFLRSSVVKLINAGQIAKGCQALLLYVYVRVNGKLVVVPWQVKRRGIENQLCMAGVDG
jgi:lysozyme